MQQSAKHKESIPKEIFPTQAVCQLYQILILYLIKLKDNLLNNKSLILVGESENGKMLSINFGCYG